MDRPGRHRRSRRGRPAPIKWQPLPSGINPIYAVAITPDGQYAACGRANQIFVYHLASGQLVTRLTDPALVKSGLYQNQGVAHLDLVQSLAFSPDGNLLASGGYREVKLWRRPHNVHRADLAGGSGAVQAIAISPDGKWAATGEASGAIKLWDLATRKDPKTLAGHTAAVTGVRFLPGGAKLVSGSLDKTIRLWNVADGAAAGQVETPAPVNALALVADGAQLATGGADNVIRLWTLPADASRRDSRRRRDRGARAADHGAGRLRRPTRRNSSRPAPTARSASGTWPTISRFARSSTAPR